MFPEPDEPRWDRGSNPHLAFGHGIHYCLGAHLGKVELAVAIATLLRTFPGMRLAVAERDLRWRTGLAFPRPETLPISW